MRMLAMRGLTDCRRRWYRALAVIATAGAMVAACDTDATIDSLRRHPPPPHPGAGGIGVVGARVDNPIESTVEWTAAGACTLRSISARNTVAGESIEKAEVADQ